MIADLDTGPVAADPLIPVEVAGVLVRPTADIVAGFGGGEGVALAGALASQDDQGAGEGEVGGGGLDGEYAQGAFFETTAGAIGEGKKGEL